MNRPPHIVLIMTDQQRADFFRSEGFLLDTLPFVDALSTRGTRFHDAYTPMPVCEPARTSMLTGRFPKAARVRENGTNRNLFGPQDLVGTLRMHGYSVNLVGKNHSYLKPEECDFHVFYRHRGGGRPEQATPREREYDAWLEALPHGWSLEPTPFPVECQLPYRIVSDAIECVDTRDERPFFLWLSFPEPHNPYQVPEPYFSLFPEAEIPSRVAGPEAAEIKGPKWRWMRRLLEEKLPGYDAHWRRYRANYCGMLRLLDDQIRRFVGHLESRGLMAHTLLIFTSDHGDYAADYGLLRKGIELPECLIRVPLLFVGPDVAARSLAPPAPFVSLVDIMPTLCEAIGAEIPYGVQGRSLWPILMGRDYPVEEFRSMYAELGFGGVPYDEEERPELHFPYEGPEFDELNSVTQSGNLKMVRKGNWKLLFDVMGRGQLYDLERDPGELTNRFEDPACREARLEMVEELLRWTLRTEDDLPCGRYVPKRAERNWYR